MSTGGLFVTEMLALVFAVMPPLVTSETVTVVFVRVFRVMLNVPVPAERAVFAGRTAEESVDVKWTTSELLMVFQLAST